MFAELFDAKGNRLSVVDPGRLIAETFDRSYFRQHFPFQTADYWFVWDCSDDPEDKRGTGFYKISLTVVGRFLRKKLDIGYANHSAAFSHFDLDRALGNYPGTNQYNMMPQAVRELILDHVRYVEGTDLHTESENLHSVQTRSAAEIIANLQHLTGRNASELGDQIGDRLVPIFELALALEFFLGDSNNVRLFNRCLQAMVPTDQQARLRELTRKLGSQLRFG